METNIEQRKGWDIKSGNTVKVWQKIKEGDKFRLQAFEGLIIAHKHGYEPGATFTVRKISDGIRWERKCLNNLQKKKKKKEKIKKIKSQKSETLLCQNKTGQRNKKENENIESGREEVKRHRCRQTRGKN